jgi:hypothetical protein
MSAIVEILVNAAHNKASQNHQQAGWTRKLAFAGRRYMNRV